VPEPGVLAPRLPLAVRVRLTAASRIDGMAGWLCGHRRTDIAIWLWRVCRMW
jgi:hypothetical protein